MTAILDNETVTETPAPVEPAPMLQTFTVGTITIEAHDEAEALRKYKRLVRAEAMKAKADQNWCDSGTNERLRILGLREVGQGVPMKVTVTATRTAYINVDAESPDEALSVVNEGGDELLAQVSATIGRGWTATAVSSNGSFICDPDKKRAVGDEDDTLAALSNQGVYVNIRQCEREHHGYYCTMPRGHEGDHVAGNGYTIRDVWRNNTRRA